MQNSAKSTLSHSPQPPAAPRLLIALVLVLLATPIFLLGLVFCLKNNIDTYLRIYERDIIFRVAMKVGTKVQTAEDLARQWTQTSDWKSAEVVSPKDVFAQIEELQSWVEDKENRMILAQIPPAVDLRPVRFLPHRQNPEDLIQNLREAPQVDHVFYDPDAFRYLQRVAGETGAITLPLQIVFLILALLAGVFAGWTYGKLGGRAKLWALACAGFGAALAALALLATVFAIAYLSTDLIVEFLSIAQILILLALGIGLGLTAWALSRAGGQSFAAVILLTPVLLAPANASTPAALPEPKVPSLFSSASPSALPPSSPRTLDEFKKDLAKLNAEQRAERLSELSERIEQSNRLVRYLDEWLIRTQRDDLLDKRNREANEQELKPATKELSIFRKEVEQRQNHLVNLCEALGPASRLPKSPRMLANSAPGTRRELAQHLLMREAAQAAHFLDQDRLSLSKTQTRVDRLREESRRLKAFEQLATYSPEDIEKEKERLLAEKKTLAIKSALLSAPPEKPQPPKDIASATPDSSPAETPSSPAALPTPSRTKPPRPLPSLAAPLYDPRIIAPLAGKDPGYYLLTPELSLIHAIGPGIILHAAPFKGLGEMVSIDHGEGISTQYYFLAEGWTMLELGQTVQAGQIIGAAGIVREPFGEAGIRFEVRMQGKLHDLSILPGITPEKLQALLLGQ